MNKISLSLLIILLSTILNAVPIRILFTNDTHSYYLPQKFQMGDQKIMLGGYANLERLLNHERSAYLRNLTFDSGDQHTGTAFSSYIYESVKGGAVVEVFNKLGYSAATFGNHEFDNSLSDAKGYMRLAKYPYINSNLMEDKEYFSQYTYKIFQFDSLNVGVIGLIMTELPEKVTLASIKGLSVLPYKQAIDKVIDEVDKQSDLVIILTHIGVDADSLLATQLDSRVDLILGGHTHAILEQPLMVNGILITQTGAQMVYLGELDIDVQNDRINTWKHILIPVEDQKNISTELSSFVDDIAQKVESESGKQIGDLTIPWIPDKFKETTVSRWQAKALYETYHDSLDVDFSVINCGGMRTSLQPGPITVKAMQEMVPFGNVIETFTCTGKEIYQMLELNYQLSKTQEHDIVQAYPITYDIIDKDQNSHIQNVCINGKPVRLKQTYQGISHDYVLSHADKYLAFTPGHMKDQQILFVDQLIDYVKKHKVVGE